MTFPYVRIFYTTCSESSCDGQLAMPSGTLFNNADWSDNLLTVGYTTSSGYSCGGTRSGSYNIVIDVQCSNTVTHALCEFDFDAGKELTSMVSHKSLNCIT